MNADDERIAEITRFLSFAGQHGFSLCSMEKEGNILKGVSWAKIPELLVDYLRQDDGATPHADEMRDALIELYEAGRARKLQRKAPITMANAVEAWQRYDQWRKGAHDE